MFACAIECACARQDPQALGFLICFSCRRQRHVKLHSRNSFGACLQASSLLMLQLEYVATLGNKIS